MRQEACAAAREALPVESTEVNTTTPDATIRDGEMEGVLHVVGELGFRRASVRAVLEYSGGHRKQFYDHFDSLEDCFAQAYAAWINRLGVTLIEGAIAADAWRSSIRAGLIELLRFVEQRPEISRALFVEVHIANGEALRQHDTAIERLAGLLDSVREEIPADEQPPEPTGIFVIGGVEAAICDALSGGEAHRVWDALPELVHLIVGSYLGKDAAEEDCEATREWLNSERAQIGGEGE